MLHKARHYKYFRVLKHLMKNRPNMLDLGIKGYRFLVRGKLRARTRRRRLSLSFGKVAIYDYNTKIHYHRIHVVTLYGVFGMNF
jgi:ribosomal protein S3